MNIKFLTLNLFDGGKFFDNILDFFRKENPDILAVQEVYDGQGKDLPRNFRSIQVLREHLPGFHYHFAPEFLFQTEIANVEIGNAIFSRFPVKSNNVTFVDVSYRRLKREKTQTDFSHEPVNLQHIKILTSGQHLNVFNIHGVWGVNGKDNPRRLKMSQVIVEKIKNLDNIILAGDFNTLPNTETIRNIENHLVNVFKNQLKSTFNMKHKITGGYSTAVVDMIFTSPSIKIIDQRMPEVNVSDHMPLVCTLEV